jgi:hypothetical protein
MGLLRKHGVTTASVDQLTEELSNMLASPETLPGDWWLVATEARDIGFTAQEIKSCEIDALTKVARARLVDRWFTREEADSLEAARLSMRADYSRLPEDVRETLTFYGWVDRIRRSPEAGAMLSHRFRAEDGESIILECPAQYWLCLKDRMGGAEPITISRESRLTWTAEPPPLEAETPMKKRAGNVLITTRRVVFVSEGATYNWRIQDAGPFHIYGDAIALMGSATSMAPVIQMNTRTAMSVALAVDAVLLQEGLTAV